MNMSLSDPFHEISRLRARLRAILDSTYQAADIAPQPDMWTPAADVMMIADGLEITLELCGVKTDAVEAVVTGDVLTVSGIRKRLQAEEIETYYALECPAGKFSRSFSLSFVPSAHSATLDDGILTITLKR